MKSLAKYVFLLLGLSLVLPGYAATDPIKSAIKARQGDMRLRAFYAGQLFAMAKGDMPYEAEKAKKLANNLVQLLDIDISDTWVKGSDIEAYPDDTTALKKIWTTYPEIGKYGKKYVTAVQDMGAVAGNGLDQLKSKAGALGKACKGCHDEFREKK